MFKIGSRTIKTAIGAPISIFIAQLLNLDNFISAAILTILCIKITRRSSILNAWYRFYACIIGLAVSAFMFELIGYFPLTVGIVLLIFIPITVKLKITEGVITSSVIILHVYGAGEVTLGLIINEIVLLLVGIGVALVLNLYMPSLESNLEEVQKDVEKNFSVILKEIAHFLKTGDHSWTGAELTKVSQLLDQASELASRDVENHLLRSHHPYYHYFHMRQKQFEILERMLPLISRIHATEDEYYYIGELFENLSKKMFNHRTQR